MTDDTALSRVSLRLNTHQDEILRHWERFNLEPTGMLARALVCERIRMERDIELEKLIAADVTTFQKLQGVCEGYRMAIAIINDTNLFNNQPEKSRTI